jgi:hypothetical protein
VWTQNFPGLQHDLEKNVCFKAMRMATFIPAKSIYLHRELQYIDAGCRRLNVNGKATKNTSV